MTDAIKILTFYPRSNPERDGMLGPLPSTVIVTETEVSCVNADGTVDMYETIGDAMDAQAMLASDVMGDSFSLADVVALRAEALGRGDTTTVEYCDCAIDDDTDMTGVADGEITPLEVCAWIVLEARIAATLG